MEDKSKIAVRCCLLTALALGLTAPAQSADLVRWGGGGLSVGGEASGSAAVGDRGWFNQTEYSRSLMHLGRLGLSAELRVADRVALLAEVRSENLDTPSLYALYLRVRPWTHRNFDVQAGRIPPVFGAFARRRYGTDNPLIGYPLVYQYLTTVRPDAIPTSADDLLRVRGDGWLVSYPIGSYDVTPGSPLVSALRWDTGIEAHGGSDTFEIAVAVTQGTLSDPRTKDNNSGKQYSARADFHPGAGIVVGLSGARGEYLSRGATAYLPRPLGGVGMQSGLGVDLEWSSGYWILRAEAVGSQWNIPAVSQPYIRRPLRAVGGFAEGRYKLAPGFYVAVRADYLGFNDITGSAGTIPWDAPVSRIEAGVGYSPYRNLWLKAAYQHDWREGGPVRSQGIGAVQASYGF